MSVVIGPQPVKHNVYSLEDWLSFDPARGTIQTRGTQRTIAVSEDFLIGMQAGLEAEVGDASAVVLYKCGYQWGIADMKRFEASFAREYGRDVQAANIQFAMETWWWPLQAMGWGSWEIDFNKSEQGIVVVNLYDSVVAKTLGEIGKPVCYLYAGMFAGVLSHLSRRKLAGIEIQCYAMGATYCRFVIGSEKRINAVEFWLEEGATASDVLLKL